MRYKKIYFGISLLFLIPGVISLLLWGLNPSIDFAGGSMWEFRVAEEVEDRDAIVASLTEIFENAELDVFMVEKGQGQEITFKLPHLSQELRTELLGTLSEQGLNVQEARFETVGPTLGAELVRNTITGIAIAALLILAYIAWRFKDRMYGVCAVLAMLHDMLIVLGVFSILGHFFDVEVDALFVTAVLTILSFSVHDTIVVYDRIRESIRKYPKEEFITLVNRAVSETLVRSLNNSLTIIFMLLALLLLGGESIRWFVFALLVGTLAGTYSSTFTAAPLVALWHERWGNKAKSKKR